MPLMVVWGTMLCREMELAVVTNEIGKGTVLRKELRLPLNAHRRERACVHCTHEREPPSYLLLQKLHHLLHAVAH